MRKLYKSIFTTTPIDSAARNASISSATTITLPSDATGILLQADTDDVRFTIDGTTPTASLGFRLSSTAAAPLRLDLRPGSEVKVISSTGAINYQLFRTEDAKGMF